MTSIQASDTFELLRSIPLFSELSDTDLHAVDAMALPHQLAQGEVLFHCGEMPTGFHVLVSGQIKLAFSSAKGNEKIVDVITPGMSFGEAVMFMNRPYPVFAEALSETSLITINQRAIFALIEKDADFARKLLAGLSIRLHSLVRDVETYTLRSSAQRVVSHLLELALAAPLENDKPVVVLAVSKQVLASRLNITPETLSRVFHELAENGLISVSGKRIQLLDPSALARFEG